jgi:hypothetical protein
MLQLRKQELRWPSSLWGTLAVMLTAMLGVAFGPVWAQGQLSITFHSDAAVILHFVKPGSTAVYEGAMARVSEALQKGGNTDIDREAQARGWKLYRADLDISGQGNVMYVSVIDPVIPGAEYASSTILTDVFPAEAQELREAYDGAFADAPLQHLPINLSSVETRPASIVSDRGTFLLHFVERGSAPAYENVMRRLGEAWQDSAISARRPQAFGWRVFRAVDNITGRGDVMYVWLLHSATGATGDTVLKIMTDLLPTDEFREFSEIYEGSLADLEHNRLQIDLRLVTDSGGNRPWALTCFRGMAGVSWHADA